MAAELRDVSNRRRHRVAMWLGAGIAVIIASHNVSAEEINPFDFAFCPAIASAEVRSLGTEMSMLFDTTDFPPRWRCGSWSPALGWLHIVSDLAIFVSYVTIPVALLVFVRKRRDVPFTRLFFLFGAFIVFCGMTHAMEALIFYWPAYRVAGLLKLATAVVSLVTSAVLIRVIPKALLFKSPTELQEIVTQQTFELRRANESLQTANAQLEEAKQAAEQANRMKSAFLANVSHEIRTPMTAILGFTELLADQNHDDPDVKRSVETVMRNGKHLLSVVNDILDLSKIEADQLQIEPAPMSPLQILQDVCTLYEGHASNKGLLLHRSLADEVPTQILADSTRVKQILANLITNALKFTDAGSIRVEMSVHTAHKTESLCVEVIDSGIGMSPSQQARIFKPFSQVDESTTRRFAGTGLGLTISRRLATLMGGSLELVKSEVGRGSQFRLMLPLVRCEGEFGISVPAESNDEEGILPGGPIVPLSGCHVLLADDGIDNQRLFAVLLKRAGARVTVADNGRDAVRLAIAALSRDNPFDVILMDMQMPIQDGYSATRELREASYKGAIVALTAHAMSGDRQACIDAGCDDYVSKPIDRSELIRVVRKHALVNAAATA